MLLLGVFTVVWIGGWDMAEKRVRKCAGCKTPHDLHDFGAVSPYCLGRQEDQILPEGQEDESSAVQPGVQDGRKNVMTLEGTYAAENFVDDNDSDDAEVLDLQRRLEQLNIQEQNLKKRKIISDLRRQVKEKQEQLLRFEESLASGSNFVSDPPVHEDPMLKPINRDHEPQEFGSGLAARAQTLTTKDLKKMFPGQSNFSPLDAILKDLQQNSHPSSSQPGFNWQGKIAEAVKVPESNCGTVSGGAKKRTVETHPFNGQPSASPAFMLSPPNPEDLFLNLGSTRGNAKIALLIPEFVMKVIPDQDESIIDIGNNAKLSVSYGNRRPKLSEISISDFNIANVRILYRLIETGQLPTYSDVKGYLIYTVKINQLASKFSWLNVLNYDNEYRLAQAKYGFPWTYDCNHMHTFWLSGSPIQKAGTFSNKRYPRSYQNTDPSDLASVTDDGKTICRMFNRFRGCRLVECKFEHVCNRIINGRACLSPHPGYQHYVAGKSGGGTRSQIGS